MRVDRSHKYGSDLAYFQGVFDTFAVLNDPGVNLTYWFGIEKLNPDVELLQSIKNIQEEFQYVEMELNEIEKSDFTKLLERWFFSELVPNLSKSIPLSDITKDFVKQMVECLDITTYHSISIIDPERRSFPLVYDYVVIASETESYFCEFVLDG